MLPTLVPCLTHSTPPITLSLPYLRAVFLSSTQTNDDIQAVIQELSSYAYTTYNINTDENRIKMLYITPEKYSKSEQLNRMLLKLANSRMLSRFVIDEAHCLSQVRFVCCIVLCWCVMFTFNDWIWSCCVSWLNQCSFASLRRALHHYVSKSNIPIYCNTS